MNAQAKIEIPKSDKVVVMPPMDRFHEIPDAAAILCNKNGVYRQTKVFRKGNEPYAGYGTGFVRLYHDGGTSIPNMRYVGLDLNGAVVTKDALGRLYISGGA